ncbi:MAG: hypothetical protein PF692_02010 [Kiritimatiellae bacterium]|nr:hypothetical protein [Kiritimatiellia bacterium]
MKMKKEQPVTILLPKHECDLISKYGYPFEDIKHQLDNAGDIDLIRIIDQPFWWEQVVANLHISLGEQKENHHLCEKLNSLKERIIKELGINNN